MNDDVQNQVFEKVYKSVKEKYPDAVVMAEYQLSPAEERCVTCEEVSNINVENTFDSSNREKYSRLTYRVQSFSRSKKGKKSDARKLLSVADKAMWDMGFKRIAFSTLPNIYESTIYGITVIYEAVVSENNVIYKNN